VHDVVRLGDRALRLARPPDVDPHVLIEHVRTWPGVVDVVITREDVAVYFDDEPRVHAGDIEALRHLPSVDAAPRMVELPAVYDGPDLDDVARAAGIAREHVVRLHAGATYVVDAMGFAPGFAYLTGVAPELHLPRRHTPRTRVPAGSIALAGGFTGVYPFDSPGGWHLIGRVAGVSMFDEHGARLQPGNRVRFIP
jgi:KipI family sensor histidine kinase inhibitor